MKLSLAARCFFSSSSSSSRDTLRELSSRPGLRLITRARRSRLSPSIDLPSQCTVDVRIDEHALHDDDVDDEEAPAMHADADDHLPLISERRQHPYVWLSNVYTV